VAPDWDAMAVVGRIARYHGNRGQVIVNPETDFLEERFKPGAQFFVRRAPGGAVTTLTVTSARFQQGRPVIGIEGVASIGEAEQYAGLELRVAVADLQVLPEGVYYEHDLVGCAVSTSSGREVGTVGEVGGGAGHRWLTVNGPGGEVLVPFTTVICVRIDVAARRIVIDPPEGLLEANEGRR
jgi:16S rRNA processing protein RimM